MVTHALIDLYIIVTAALDSASVTEYKYMAMDCLHFSQPDFVSAQSFLRVGGLGIDLGHPFGSRKE